MMIIKSSYSMRDLEQSIHDYVNAKTTQEQIDAINTIPVQLLNSYVYDMLEALREEYQREHYREYNRRRTEFKHRMIFAIEHNVPPRGLIA